MSYSNKKGVKERHELKDVRVATHVPVLEKSIRLMGGDIHVVEHGMGKSSTPYFHSRSEVKTITSFEDDKNWMRCETCEKTNVKSNHQIHQFISKDNFYSVLSKINQLRSIVLVDGPQFQRIEALEVSQKLGFQFIIEHDAESLSKEDMTSRLDISKRFNYHTYQYVGLNPETLLYCKNVIEDADYVRC
jgi:hypothetical protein